MKFNLIISSNISKIFIEYNYFNQGIVSDVSDGYAKIHYKVHHFSLYLYF